VMERIDIILERTKKFKEISWKLKNIVNYAINI
jgi:hypothetical protein